jgi:hypothetical protein
MKRFWVGFGLLLVLTGCRAEGEEISERDISALEALVQEGDLVFRRGQGLASRAVLAADRYRVYSHAGIVVRDSGQWRVVHAVPGEAGGDRVKMEPLAVFFRPQRALKGAVMRVEDASTAQRAAVRAVELFRRNVGFDHGYDLDDTTRMYCTELIHHVFAREGVDLTGGRRSRIDMPGFGGNYILPGDLQCSVHVRPIDEF